MLEGGESVVVASGKKAKKTKLPHYVLWTKRFIWNNDGDKAVVKDSDGEVVSTVEEEGEGDLVARVEANSEEKGDDEETLAALLFPEEVVDDPTDVDYVLDVDTSTGGASTDADVEDPDYKAALKLLRSVKRFRGNFKTTLRDILELYSQIFGSTCVEVEPEERYTEMGLLEVTEARKFLNALPDEATVIVKPPRRSKRGKSNKNYTPQARGSRVTKKPQIQLSPHFRDRPIAVRIDGSMVKPMTQR